MRASTADAFFRTARPRLVRLAYRMLGSVAEAEDVVQDAYLRWLAAGPDAAREPAAFLRTIVTRLCLNVLNSARRRRETYLGPWLPEPFLDPDGDASDDITLPLMLALERLSPLERAAFLLHDVFGVDFAEIATAIGREAATCRKLASRARTHLQDVRPRYAPGRDEGLKLAAVFFEASRSGDLSTLIALLAQDIVAYADGGGKVPASPLPLVGRDAVMARHAEMARSFETTPSALMRYALIDGLPGFITVEGGGILQTTALAIEHGRIAAIYVMRNPDKLRHLAASTDRV